MSNISLRLPDSLHERLRALARREGVSINVLISSAVAEKVSALMTEDYLRERAQRGSRERYESVLARVHDVEPEPYDRLDRRGPTMIWTAWSNGTGRPGGYGLRVPVADREREFADNERGVTLELPGRDAPLEVELSASFWAGSPEIRGVAIGEWLLEGGHAPWPKRRPPRFVVEVVARAHFRVVASGPMR